MVIAFGFVPKANAVWNRECVFTNALEYFVDKILTSSVNYNREEEQPCFGAKLDVLEFLNLENLSCKEVKTIAFLAEDNWFLI
ncbi:uncharacterized protein LOC143225270 isoform X6 [Tachypleus tridentatus]|uniref:uncharacterized protein LOC143225270 isoform X6 n=1 Tax=Tachypleus tridentatus TaxID=6853 RepID=UPI003FD471A7